MQQLMWVQPREISWPWQWQVTPRISADAHCSNAAIDVGAAARDILALAMASHTPHVG